MIHPLTQIVLSILWFTELSFQRLDTGFAALEKAYTFHVGHSIPVPVVYAISQVDLMR